MAHLLVTGAAGFIGAAVTAALAARGDRVTGIDVAVGPALARLAAAHGSVTAQVCELTEWASLSEVIRRDVPDAVVHCAAVVGVPASVLSPHRTFEVNLGGSLTLFEAARLFGVPRIVHMSSEETYGAFQADRIDETHPQSPVMAYGISKLAVEHLGRTFATLYGLEVINLRTCWVYGPGLPRDRVPKIFVDAAVQGRACHLPWGESMAVDHTYIDDVVAGVLGALDLAVHPHDAYNLGSGRAATLAEIVAIIRELVPGADISAGPGAFEHSLPGASVPAVRKGALNVERAGAAFGYRPRFGIRAGLAAYVEAVRAQH
jgi:nucleoside-diphosphate-sugar epimerase